jgi:hypothetical protein
MSNEVKFISTKKCLICKGGKKNDSLYYHQDPDTGNIFVWCQGKCQRGYDLREYCYKAGISLVDFLKMDFDIKESRPNEVNKIEFPRWYVNLNDRRAEKGVLYIKSRGLTLQGDMYYDVDKEGIVFPYYYENTFCGAQVRLLQPWISKEDPTDVTKVLTLPGTRTGLLFYGWNQSKFATNVRSLIVTEGAFNALSLQQATDEVYGVVDNPFKCIACSSTGGKHHIEKLKDLKDEGLKVVLAFDTDPAGLKGLERFKDSITHYAFVEWTDIDWNDVLQKMGHRELLKYFLGRVKNVS